MRVTIPFGFSERSLMVETRRGGERIGCSAIPRQPSSIIPVIEYQRDLIDNLKVCQEKTKDVKRAARSVYNVRRIIMKKSLLSLASVCVLLAISLVVVNRSALPTSLSVSMLLLLLLLLSLLSVYISICGWMYKYSTLV